MTEFVVNGLHPHPFAAIDPAPFPVFGMYKMDSTVLECLSGSSTPIYVFEPLNMRLFDSIKAAKVRNSMPEHRLAMVSKIYSEASVYFASLGNWRNQDSHRTTLQTLDNRNSFEPESNRTAQCLKNRFHISRCR
jgi:hypothetical protein